MAVTQRRYILFISIVLYGCLVSGIPKKCTFPECNSIPEIRVAKRNLLPSLQQPNENGAAADLSKKNSNVNTLFSAAVTNDARRHVVSDTAKEGGMRSDRHAQKKATVKRKPKISKTHHSSKTDSKKAASKNSGKVKNGLKSQHQNSMNSAYAQATPNRRHRQQQQHHQQQKPLAVPIHHHLKLLDNIGKRLNLINKIESKLKSAFNINTTTSKSTTSSKKKKVSSHPSSSKSAPTMKPTAVIAAGKNQKIMVLISKNGNMISLNRFKKLQSKGLVKGITPVYVRDAHGNVLFAVPVARKLKNKNYMLSKKLIMVSNEELKGFLERYNLELPENKNQQDALQASPQNHQQLKDAVNTGNTMKNPTKTTKSPRTGTPSQKSRQQGKNQRSSKKPTASMSAAQQKHHQRTQPAMSQVKFHHNKPTPQQSTTRKHHGNKPTVSSSLKHQSAAPVKAAKYHESRPTAPHIYQYSPPTVRSENHQHLRHHQNGLNKFAPHHERAYKKNITDLQVIDGNEFTINDEAIEGEPLKNTTLSGSLDQAMTRELIDDGEIVPVSSTTSKSNETDHDQEIEEKMLKMEAFFKENNDTRKVDSSDSRNKVNFHKKELTSNQTFIVDLTEEPAVSNKADGIKTQQSETQKSNANVTSSVVKSPEDDSANKTTSSGNDDTHIIDASLSTTSSNKTSSAKKLETPAIDSSDLFESKDFTDDDQDETFTLSFLPNNATNNENATKSTDVADYTLTTGHNTTNVSSSSSSNTDDEAPTHDEQLSYELAEAGAESTSSTTVGGESNTNNTVVLGEKSSTVSSNETSSTSTKGEIHDSQIEDELDEAEGVIFVPNGETNSTATTNTTAHDNQTVVNSTTEAITVQKDLVTEDHGSESSAQNDTTVAEPTIHEDQHQEADSRDSLDLNNSSSDKAEDDEKKLKQEKEEGEAKIETHSRDSVKDKEKPNKQKDKEKSQVENESRQSESTGYQETQCRPCHGMNPYDLQITQKTPLMNSDNSPHAVYPSPVFSVSGKSNPLIPARNLNLQPCCKNNIEETLPPNNVQQEQSNQTESAQLAPVSVNDQTVSNSATESNQAPLSEQPVNDQTTSSNNNPYPAPKIDISPSSYQAANQFISNNQGVGSAQQRSEPASSLQPDSNPPEATALNQEQQQQQTVVEGTPDATQQQSSLVSQIQTESFSPDQQQQQIQSTESAASQLTTSIAEQQQTSQYQGAGETAQAQYPTTSLKFNPGVGVESASNSPTTSVENPTQQQFASNAYSNFAAFSDAGSSVQQPQQQSNMQEITPSFANTANQASFQNFDNMNAFQLKKAMMAYNRANPSPIPPISAVASPSTEPTDAASQINVGAGKSVETVQYQQLDKPSQQQKQGGNVSNHNHNNPATPTSVSNNPEYVEASTTPEETQPTKESMKNQHFKYPIKSFDFDDDAEKDDDEVEAEEGEEEQEEEEKTKKVINPKKIQKLSKSSKLLSKQTQKNVNTTSENLRNKAANHQAPLTRHTTVVETKTEKNAKSLSQSKSSSKNIKEKTVYLKELSTILKESEELSRALQDQATEYLRGKSSNKSASPLTPTLIKTKNPASPKVIKELHKPQLSSPTVASTISSATPDISRPSFPTSSVTPGRIPQNLAGFESILSKIKTTAQQQLQAYYQQQFAGNRLNSNQYNPSYYQQPQQLQQYQQTPQSFYSNSGNIQQQQYFNQNPLQQNTQQYERMPTTESVFGSSYTAQSQSASPTLSQFQTPTDEASYSQQEQQTDPTELSSTALNTVSIANDKNYGLDSMKPSPSAYAETENQQSFFYPMNMNPTIPSSNANGISRDLKQKENEEEEEENIHSYPSPKFSAVPKVVKQQHVDLLAGWSKAVTRDTTQPKPRLAPNRKPKYQRQQKSQQQRQQKHQFSEKSYFINNGILDETHHEKAMNFLSSFLKHISGITHNPSFWKKEDIQHSPTTGSKRDIVLGPVINELEEASRAGNLGTLVGRIFDDDDGGDVIGAKKDDIATSSSDLMDDYGDGDAGPLESGIITMLQTDEDEKVRVVSHCILISNCVFFVLIIFW